jgi:hypothetical protein
MILSATLRDALRFEDELVSERPSSVRLFDDDPAPAALATPTADAGDGVDWLAPSGPATDATDGAGPVAPPAPPPSAHAVDSAPEAAGASLANGLLIAEGAAGGAADTEAVGGHDDAAPDDTWPDDTWPDDTWPDDTWPEDAWLEDDALDGGGPIFTILPWYGDPAGGDAAPDEADDGRVFDDAGDEAGGSEGDPGPGEAGGPPLDVGIDPSDPDGASGEDVSAAVVEVWMPCVMLADPLALVPLSDADGASLAAL